MQVCASLQTDNHTSTPTLCFFTGRMPFLPPNQQRQNTGGIKALQANIMNSTTQFHQNLSFKKIIINSFLGGAQPPSRSRSLVGWCKDVTTPIHILALFV